MDHSEVMWCSWQIVPRVLLSGEGEINWFVVNCMSVLTTQRALHPPLANRFLNLCVLCCSQVRLGFCSLWAECFRSQEYFTFFFFLSSCYAQFWLPDVTPTRWEPLRLGILQGCSSSWESAWPVRITIKQWIQGLELKTQLQSMLEYSLKSLLSGCWVLGIEMVLRCHLLGICFHMCQIIALQGSYQS